MPEVTILSFTLNGKKLETAINPGKTLLEVIRKNLQLTGTKKACGEGECGACTVLLDGLPVNSCILPAMKAQGREVMTIENFSQDGEISALQQAFLESGAVQCGFCTPGVIMSSKALLDRVEKPSEEEIKNELSGHICRCTGYIQFVDAVKLAAERREKDVQ